MRLRRRAEPDGERADTFLASGSFGDAAALHADVDVLYAGLRGVLERATGAAWPLPDRGIGGAVARHDIDAAFVTLGS